jgi:hypothetical protein
MAESIYLLCALTSAICAGLLLRGFARTGVRFLFWSSLCFLGLALNNLLLLVDMVVLVKEVELSMERAVVATIGLSALVFGLVWES